MLNQTKRLKLFVITEWLLNQNRKYSGRRYEIKKIKKNEIVSFTVRLLLNLDGWYIKKLTQPKTTR